MRRPSEVVSIAAAIGLLSVAACERQPARDGGPGDGGDADRAADVDLPGDGAPSDADEDSPADPGQLTFLLDGVSVLEERICDIDGDGRNDNAVAELGTSSTMVAMVLNSIIQASMLELRRLVIHFPWVEDRTRLTDDTVVCLVFHGVDTDDPPNPDDDYDGGEPFFVRPDSLDPCGEPISSFPVARLAAGSFEAEDGVMELDLGGVIRAERGSAMGTIAADRRSLEMNVCGLVMIADAGSRRGFSPDTDLTMLEALTAGGAAMGLPAVPGIVPDIDVDGDGLERIGLDDESHVELCIDGDRSVIEGPQCWQDPRMADGFSLAFAFTGVDAVYAGRLPGWEELVEGTCDGGPPEHSLFDPP